jgi:hypothetical protein
MSRSSVHEFAAVLRQRYQVASRAERKGILDEFLAVSSYHRKSAIRLFALGIASKPKAELGKRRGRPRQYAPAVAAALQVLWESADCICSRRLPPFVPKLLDVLRRHGELVLQPEVEGQLCRMSSSTMDRLLYPCRQRYVRRGLSTTKPGTLLKESIPVRTFADWDDKRPGFLEGDLVAHCGESAGGFFLYTLSTVDVATGWSECIAVWGKGQERVGGGVDAIKRRLPFPLLGLDTDNGSEFINRGLYDYCRRYKITFTRSRPYKKNDQCHVEQKNWTVVRRVVGYDRYSSHAALALLNEVYEHLRHYVNFFQPVLKLVSKERQGAKVHKCYDIAQTPYERLCASKILDPAKEAALEKLYQTLNPVQLRKRIDQALEKLWALAEKEKLSDKPVERANEGVACG